MHNNCKVQYPGKCDLHICYFTEVIQNLINMKFPLKVQINESILYSECNLTWLLAA